VNMADRRLNTAPREAVSRSNIVLA
jgi:hypothetical protein